MIEELDFPGYFLGRLRHRHVLPGQEHLLPGPGIGGELGGLLRAAASRTSTRCGMESAVRTVPRAGARRAAGHRRGHRVRPSRGGHPARLPEVRPAATPPRSRTSSPTGPGRRCGTSPRRWDSRPASRMRGASGSTTGARSTGGSRREEHSGAGRGVRQRAADVPPAPRHPLRRHGDLRPAGDRGVPGRVGADGGPHGAAVGQGRLRRHRAGQVRPARPRHALRAALRVRHDRH